MLGLESVNFISIHSLHTEGDYGMGGSRMSFFISIHSLHTEGDSGTLHSATYREDFNPLPPHGGRHYADCHIFLLSGISIHSLHTEGDTFTNV